MSEFDEKGQEAIQDQEPASDYQEPSADYQEPSLDYQEPVLDNTEPAPDKQEQEQEQEPAPEQQAEQPSSFFKEPPPAYPPPPPYGFQAPPPPPPGYPGPPPYSYQTPPPYGYQGPPPYAYHDPYGAQYYNRPVGFIEAYKAYWMNAFNFNDRTTRAGYWWAYLMNMIICIVLYIIFFASVFTTALSSGYFYDEPYGMFLGLSVGTILITIWALANIVPGLSITIRRLHDTGKAWYWIFISLIPFVGGIILIVLLVFDTKLPHENQFGELEQV